MIIVASVLAVMLESVDDIARSYGDWLRILEWVFTIGFTLEYLLRLAIVDRPLRYALSFYGVVDLPAIAPTYLSLLLPGSQSLLTIRALRLLRVFRVFKLGRFLGEQNLLMTALRASRAKLIVFVATVLILTLILGSAMHLIEGDQSGFTSVPRGLYWAIVTMTTVGYGDIAPVTIPGQIVASVVMLLGYSIIAVPSGIVTSELLDSLRGPLTTRSCHSCTSHGHAVDARFCKDCGASLE